MLFDAELYAEFVELYISNNLSGREAARAYANKYPERRHPNRQVFIDAYRRFREYGSGVPRPREGVPVINVRADEQIIRIFDNEPNLSVRRASARLNPSKSHVHRVLKSESNCNGY